MIYLLLGIALFVGIVLGVQFMRRRRIRRMTSTRHDYYRKH